MSEDTLCKEINYLLLIFPIVTFPSSVTVTVILPVVGVISLTATSPILASALVPVHPSVFCCILTVSVADFLSAESVAFPEDSPVNTVVEHSAYAALRLAKSVASFAFSNWLVKIGIFTYTYPQLL